MITLDYALVCLDIEPAPNARDGLLLMGIGINHQWVVGTPSSILVAFQLRYEWEDYEGACTFRYALSDPLGNDMRLDGSKDFPAMPRYSQHGAYGIFSSHIVVTTTFQTPGVYQLHFFIGDREIGAQLLEVLTPDAWKAFDALNATNAETFNRLFA